MTTSFNTPGFAYDVTLKGDYAYVADEKSGVIKIDISKPTNPRFAGSFNTAGETVHIITIGEYIYASDTNSLIIMK